MKMLGVESQVSLWKFRSDTLEACDRVDDRGGGGGGGVIPETREEREGRGQNPGRSQLLTSRQRQVFHGGDWQGAAHKVEGERGCNHL